MAVTGFLPKVKRNLIIDFDDDDAILNGYITAAVAYAESYQHLDLGYYTTHDMPATTEQGIIMLASYFYGSRYGSNEAYLSGGTQVMDTIHMMLRADRDWKV